MPLVVLVLEEAIPLIVLYARNWHDSVNMSFPPSANELVQSEKQLFYARTMLAAFWVYISQAQRPLVKEPWAIN